MAPAARLRFPRNRDESGPMPKRSATRRGPCHRRLLPSNATSCLRIAAVVALALAGGFVSPGPAAALPGDTGPIRRITFDGNRRTQEVVLRRVMVLSEGDTLDAGRLDAAWDRLEDCGWFRWVDLEVNPTDDGGVELGVTVEEDLTTYYGPLLRHSRRHNYLAGAWLEERNLRGLGQTLRFELSAWRLQMAGAEWRVPWLAGVRGLTGTVGLRGEQADFVFRPTRYRKWDASVGARWNFRGPYFVEAGVRTGRFTQRDPYAWAPPARGGAVIAALVEQPAGSVDHWRVGGGVGLDSRDNPYYPRRGAAVLLEAARWSGDGIDGYDELVGDARAFVPLPAGKHLLALRAWGRRVGGPTQLDNTLFLGGPDNVRGAGFGSLEGEEGWLLTAEYRLPLVMVPIAPGGESVGLGLHAFVDGGQAWWDGAEPGAPVVTWGVGTHVSLDTWQLRFEAARDEAGDWHFEFADRFSF